MLIVTIVENISQTGTEKLIRPAVCGTEKFSVPVFENDHNFLNDVIVSLCLVLTVRTRLHGHRPGAISNSLELFVTISTSF